MSLTNPYSCSRFVCFLVCLKNVDLPMKERNDGYLICTFNHIYRISTTPSGPSLLDLLSIPLGPLSSRYYHSLGPGLRQYIGIGVLIVRY